MKIQGTYKELNLIENAQANGDYPAGKYIHLRGDYALAFYGVFDTATVEFVFFTQKQDGSLEELPVSTDFTFTAAPEAQRFSFPDHMPCKIRLSSVGASTDISINAHGLR